MDKKKENRLSQETSPYLLQHSDNPVDWFPWCKEALQEAKLSDKPILLSIGYSACHWCHVMAHESFEDIATAELMNKFYINIKIDREERPDIDKIYQTAQYLLTQRTGGWPLTMFLTPQDQMPFFGGTYFPKDDKYGLPSFKSILLKVFDYYQHNKDELQTQNTSMRHALRDIFDAPENEVALNNTIFKRAVKSLTEIYDKKNGGFGLAPKFPHPSNIDFLSYCIHKNNKEDYEGVREMINNTLEKMQKGGIRDHVGGGFFRYSVDEFWAIPHFEKMLYDNGLLLSAYSQAKNVTGTNEAASELIRWVTTEMQSIEGGYFSSLDADSNGEEGKYYVWEKEEVKKILSQDNYSTFSKIYGLEDSANFEGKWHLNIKDTVDHKNWVDKEKVISQLYEHRQNRQYPHRDEKILTSWNALMIKGMADAACFLNKNECAESAIKALGFIEKTMWKNGRLFATYKDGKAHLNGYLDDYAFLIHAILSLLQVKWDTKKLIFAEKLAKKILEKFEDKEKHGFYFTSNDHETLIQRPKILSDEATPSGYGISCLALSRLGHLMCNNILIDASVSAIKYAAKSMNQSPAAHTTLLTAYDEMLSKPEIIIIRGEGDSLNDWHQCALKKHNHSRLVFAIPNEEKDLPDVIGLKKGNKQTTAYLCKGMTCQEPIVDKNIFIEKL
jgi:hypothetical protein